MRLKEGAQLGQDAKRWPGREISCSKQRTAMAWGLKGGLCRTSSYACALSLCGEGIWVILGQFGSGRAWLRGCGEPQVRCRRRHPVALNATMLSVAEDEVISRAGVELEEIFPTFVAGWVCCEVSVWQHLTCSSAKTPFALSLPSSRPQDSRNSFFLQTCKTLFSLGFFPSFFPINKAMSAADLV